MFLLYTIKTKYDLRVKEVIHASPRFAIMMFAMGLSIIFIILDVLSVIQVLKSVLPVGINPFWKLSFVFKCLTDTVILDDFKTALDRITAFKHGQSQVLEYLPRAGTRNMRGALPARHVRSTSTWDEDPSGYQNKHLPVATSWTEGGNSSHVERVSYRAFSDKSSGSKQCPV